jgi:hypothetical protein
MANKRVHIEQTDTEFVLSLPYDQRQRAKFIATDLTGESAGPVL